MNSRISILAVAFFIGLSACGQQGGASDAAPLAGATIGGPFTLTNQDGKRVTDRDFAGSYRLIYFGYSFCPDVCPIDLQKLMAGYRLLEKSDPATAAKIQPLFITVDPQRDTPAVLNPYVSAFHPRLIGLTGTDAEIAAVTKEFAIVSSRVPSADPKAYLVDHSRQAYLFGPQGEPIALISQDGEPALIAEELARWAGG